MNLKTWKVLIVGTIILLSCNQTIGITNVKTTLTNIIDGNSNLAAISVSGTGTLQDPYILSNFSISCSNYLTPSLVINNTNSYFIFQDSTSQNCKYGLVMNNVSNAWVKNLSQFDGINVKNAENIKLENVESKYQNYLENTNDFVINNSTFALFNTNNGTIQHCNGINSISNSTNIRIKDSSLQSLRIYNSVDLDFQENSLSGVLTIQNGTNIIFTSTTGTISSGTIQDSNNVVLANVRNIEVKHDKNIILRNITVDPGEFKITDSQNITVENSTFKWFNEVSEEYSNINVNNSSEVNLLNNRIESSYEKTGQRTVNLIYISYSNKIHIIDNWLNFSSIGIILDNVENSLIDKNNFTDIGTGIILHQSSLNTVSNNLITSSDTGIYLSNASNNILKNNSYIDVSHVYRSTLTNTNNAFLDNTSSGLPAFNFGVLLFTICIIIKQRRKK